MDCKLSKNIVDKLILKYGSPLYIFHRNEFAKNYNDLIHSMRNVYSKYNIAYSYKTNYTPKIIQLVKELGGLAEVVSEMEYQLAKKIGYKNDYIVYNGPVKGEGLFEHLLSGGVANIDSLDELDTVIELAKNNSNKIIKIAFRVNIDINQDFISRFGIDSYEDDRDSDLGKGINKINLLNNIKLVGLHCHIGRSRSIEAWENRIRIMFKLIDRYFGDTTPEFIDLGSGMNSIMEPELAKQFNGHIPTFDEYASVVAYAMNKKYGNLPYDKQPWLFTEPGTTLVSGTMSFLSSVKTIKKRFKWTSCFNGN